MHRLIMHIDMDAFFASIEQQLNPRLRNKPVIVIGRHNKNRSVVCAASYQAKAKGIDSGMPSWQALKVCPDAICVVADSAKYLYTSQRIFEILKEFSPKVEMASVDEFFLDITGLEGLFGSCENLSKIIKHKIKEEFGISCSIGIAGTKLISKLAAKLDKPDGLVIIKDEEVKTVLKDVPVEKICGIGPRLKIELNKLGIYTCGDLSTFPLKLLVRKFGKLGFFLHMASKGQDSSSIGQEYPPKSVGHSQTLSEATSDIETVKTWLRLLSEMVGFRLRDLHLQGRTIHVYLNFGYLVGFSKQKTFFQATNDGYEVFKRAIFIAGLEKGLKVRALGVSVSSLCVANQIFMFEQEKARNRLINSIDKINRKFGDWTVFPSSLILNKSAV
ncbi:MAG: DNA polymerase IV [Candidatus Omnitrophota bacterium]